MFRCYLVKRCVSRGVIVQGNKELLCLEFVFDIFFTVVVPTSEILRSKFSCSETNANLVLVVVEIMYKVQVFILLIHLFESIVVYYRDVYFRGF